LALGPPRQEIPIFYGHFGCSFIFCRSFQKLEGKDQEHGWRIARCIVMCHRLKESRIATKRFGSQSPIQSFPDAQHDDGSRSPANQQGPTRQLWPLRPTALATWSHIVSFSNLQFFPCGDQSVPDARSSRMIGKLERRPLSSVMVEL